MDARRWEIVTGAVAVLLLFFTAYGNALLLGLISGGLLAVLLAYRVFVVHDGPRPGWLVTTTVVGFSMAVAIAWLLQR